MIWTSTRMKPWFAMIAIWSVVPLVVWGQIPAETPPKLASVAAPTSTDNNFGVPNFAGPKARDFVMVEYWIHIGGKTVFRKQSLGMIAFVKAKRFVVVTSLGIESTDGLVNSFPKGEQTKQFLVYGPRIGNRSQAVPCSYSGNRNALVFLEGPDKWITDGVARTIQGDEPSSFEQPVQPSPTADPNESSSIRFWTDINKSYDSYEEAAKHSSLIFGVTRDGTSIRTLYVQAIGTAIYDSESLRQLFTEVMEDREAEGTKKEFSQQEIAQSRMQAEIAQRKNEAAQRSLFDAQQKTESAKKRLDLESLLTDKIRSDLAELKQLVAAGAGNLKDLRDVEKELTKQQLAQLNAETALHDAESALAQKRAELDASNKATLAITSQLREVERQVAGAKSKVNDASNQVKRETVAIPASDREQLREQLLAQFRAERETRKKEIEQLRARVEKLEQAERTKLENIESIINKRLEQLLQQSGADTGLLRKSSDPNIVPPTLGDKSR